VTHTVSVSVSVPVQVSNMCAQHDGRHASFVLRERDIFTNVCIYDVHIYIHS